MSETPSPLRHLHCPEEVGDEFEARVFAKIGRAKRRRRNGVRAAVIAPLALIALVAGLQVLRSPAPAPQVLTAGRGPDRDKEVVPVSAEVCFAAFDGRTRYPVERVSYAPGDAAASVPVRQEL